MGSSVQKRVRTAKTTVRPTRKRACILVLGMHRSGTSALSRVLSLLGCDLPKTLMPPSPANEPGHWESMAMYKLNDRILESAGSAWHDWLELNPRWFDSPKADEFREEAAVALAEEFGSSRLFVLKDPRICRLFPFWQDVLERSGVRPLVWVPLRNPLEVAGSLEKRNGFEPALSNLLWLRNVLDAEFASRGAQRVFSTYDQLVNGWARVAKKAESTLDLSWPRFSERAASEIDAFLSDSHRHHEDHPDDVLENPSLSAWVRETFAIMTRWAETGEDAKDRPTLVRIRGEFNAAAPAFARLIADGRAARAQAASMEKALAASAGRIEAAQAENAAKDQKIRQAEQELTSARDRIAEREKALSELRAELEKHAAVVTQQRDRVGKLETEIEALGARATTAEQSVSALRDEVMRRRQEVERIEEGKASAERNLASLRNEMEAQVAATAEAERRFVEMRDRLSETQSALRQRSLEAEQTAAEASKLREQLRHRDGEFSEARKEIEAIRRSSEDAKERAESKQRQAEELDEQVRLLQLEQSSDRAALAAQQAEARRLAEAVEEANADRTSKERQLQLKLDEIVQLTRMQMEREVESARQIAELQSAVAVRASEASRLEIELEKANADRTSKERQLQLRLDEIVQLTRMQMEREVESARQTAELQSAVAVRESEASRLETELEKAKADYAAEIRKLGEELIKNNAERAAETKRLKDEIAKAQAERVLKERQLKERFDEIARLTRLLAERSSGDQRQSVVADKAGAEKKTNDSAIPGVPDSALSRHLPERLRIRLQMRKLRQSGLFDSEWYLRQYEDVAKAGVDPLRHYVMYGAREGRAPNGRRTSRG